MRKSSFAEIYVHYLFNNLFKTLLLQEVFSDSYHLTVKAKWVEALWRLYKLSHYLEFVHHNIHKYFNSISCIFSLQLDIQFSKAWVIFSPRIFHTILCSEEHLMRFQLRAEDPEKQKLIFHFILNLYSFNYCLCFSLFQGWSTRLWVVGHKISSLLMTLKESQSRPEAWRRLNTVKSLLGECGRMGSLLLSLQYL